MTWKLHASMFH